MSLSTTSTLVQLQETTNPFGDPPTVAMSFWFYPTNNGVQFDLGGIGEYVSNDFNWVWLSRRSSNTMRIYKGTIDYATTSNTVTANAWNHVYGYSTGDSSRKVRLNGGTLAISTTTQTGGNGNFDAINILDKLPDWDFAGRIQEYAMWNTELSTDEQLALNAGMSPLFIRPANLSRYWPFFDSRTDTISGSTLSVLNGSHSFADHNGEVWYPAASHVVFEAAPAPSGVVTNHYYRKLLAG